MMTKSIWSEVSRIWRHKTNNFDDIKTHHILYAIKKVELLDGKGCVNWGQPNKSCGIDPHTISVMERARSELAKTGELPIKTLVVGNSSCECPKDIEEFDLVVSFNNIHNKWVIPYLTHHWMRSNSRDFTCFGGESISPVKEGMTIVLCDISNSEKLKKYDKAWCKTYRFKVRSLYPQYPSTHCSSTGFVAIASYMKWGHSVTAIGFSWQGVKAHNWEFESRTMLEWSMDGRISLPDVSPDFKITPATETVKIANGNKDIDNPSKIAHFTWIDYSKDNSQRDVNINEYWSVRTFAYHHREWRIFLHTNSDFTGPNFERLKRVCGNIDVFKLSISDIPPNIGINYKVQKSDYWSMKMLYKYGGVKCDFSDTITIKPMDSLLNSTSLLQSGNDRKNTNWHSGMIICSHPGNMALSEIISWFEYTDFTKLPRAAMESRFSSLSRQKPNLFAKKWDYLVAYPIHYTDMIFVRKWTELESVSAKTYQYHWYTVADNPASTGGNANRQFMSSATLDGWRNAKTPYAHSIRISLAGIRDCEV